MVSGCSAQLCRYIRSGAGTKLLGMHAKLHAVIPGRHQHLPRLFLAEGVIVAECIAEMGQARRCNFGNKLLGNPANVIGPTICSLRWNGVRCQKCRYDTRGTFVIEPPDDPKHLQFCFAVKSVAGFGFYGRCAGAEHPVAMTPRSSQQLIF